MEENKIRQRSEIPEEDKWAVEDINPSDEAWEEDLVKLEAEEGPLVAFAGQMTGVEGYVESASSGFVAGVNAAKLALGEDPVVFPKTTVIGALAHYVSEGGLSSNFQPMNANFGIIAPFDHKIKGGKKLRNEAYAERSLDIIRNDFEAFSKI